MLEKMEGFFQERVAGYDQYMLDTIEGAAEFYPYTASLLPAGQCRLLDLGCGTGLELEQVFRKNPFASVTGIDLSPAMLEALRKKLAGRDITLLEGSYFTLPFGEDCFDGAVSVESLHHFPAGQKLELYKKLHAALRKGGVFILTDYFAEDEAAEMRFFAELTRLKVEQGLSDEAFVHFDTPLTAEHELSLLEQAGFSSLRIMRRWENTCTLRAER